MLSIVSIADYYQTDDDFKAYVDRYSAKHRMMPEDALHHEIVRQVYKEYRFGVNRRK